MFQKLKILFIIKKYIISSPILNWNLIMLASYFISLREYKLQCKNLKFLTLLLVKQIWLLLKFMWLKCFGLMNLFYIYYEIKITIKCFWKN